MRQLWPADPEARKDALKVVGLVAAVALLPHLATCLPGLLSLPALFLGVIGCFWQTIRVIESSQLKGYGMTSKESLKAEVASAQANQAAAEERASKAEEIRAKDANRLVGVQAELDSFGDAAARTKKLESSDEAITNAAEKAWYEGQAAVAAEKMESHRQRTEALENEIPILQGEIRGLEVALEDVKSQTQQKQSEREMVDKTTEELREQVEKLKKLSREQKEELQRLEDELKVLQTSADEAKAQLKLEQKRQLWELEREATEEERKARWASGEKRAMALDNDALNALLAEKDREKDQLEEELEKEEKSRAVLESDLASLKKEVDALEISAMERDRLEREIVKEREQRGRVQENLEKLKLEIKEAQVAREQAEKAEVAAKAAAAEREREAEKMKVDATKRRDDLVEKFTDAANDHNRRVAYIQATFRQSQENYEKVEALKARLKDAELEKEKAKAEFQVVAGEASKDISDDDM
mmetsp:Transcript_98695/g.155982  ORF Transcript_98695/g.155982 Transcript_98695/m.155982 type:complete len:473 (-) Transcript_98695:7-1425(-)